jgi:hypothetical protein
MSWWRLAAIATSTLDDEGGEENPGNNGVNGIAMTRHFHEKRTGERQGLVRIFEEGDTGNATRTLPNSTDILGVLRCRGKKTRMKHVD